MKKNYVSFCIGAVLALTMLVGCETTEDITVVEDIQSAQIDTIEEKSENDDLKFILSTEDIDGNAISMEDYSDAKLIMVNFWEPWCGPCVGEMPDLERIYEEYSTDGFVILGVFSTEGMDSEVREVLDSCGITYPILRYEEHMEPFITEYVPTTILLDGHGNVLTDEPLVGGKSYDDWKQIIEGYMNR